MFVQTLFENKHCLFLNLISASDLFLDLLINALSLHLHPSLTEDFDIPMDSAGKWEGLIDKITMPLFDSNQFLQFMLIATLVLYNGSNSPQTVSCSRTNFIFKSKGHPSQRRSARFTDLLKWVFKPTRYEAPSETFLGVGACNLEANESPQSSLRLTRQSH